MKQLQLFAAEDDYFLTSAEPSSDAFDVSLPEPSSDASIHTEQDFQNNRVWVNKYSPGRRVTQYYRLSYNWHGKKKHKHIPGGNVNSLVATRRAKQLQAMIDRGASIQELLTVIANDRR